jgi:hypothetical protein
MSILRDRPFLTLAGFVAFLALATSVSAQDAHYWDIQYGPVGQLLGGQVVGSSRDLSATYYNPGGLILGEDPDFLLSVNAFKRQNLTTKPVSGGPFLSVSDTEWGTFPGFFGAAFPESWLGDRTRVAFSLLTRQQSIQRIDQRFVGNEPTTGARYGVETLYDQRMYETWGGLTFSRRLGESWGLGGTLYGVYRSQRTRSEQNLQLTGPTGNGLSALVVNDFDYDHLAGAREGRPGMGGRHVPLRGRRDDAERRALRRRKPRLHALGDGHRLRRRRTDGQRPLQRSRRGPRLGVRVVLGVRGRGRVASR